MMFRYLKGTIEFGLWYPKVNELTLIAFLDAYWEECFNYIRSTSGTTFFLGNFLVSWLRKMESLVSLSTTKEKYIAATTCCTDILWMKQTL